MVLVSMLNLSYQWYSSNTLFSKTGKTSLFRRFTSNSFVDTTNMTYTESRASTLGLDHFSRRFDLVNGKSIKLQLWDTGGLEKVASMTNSYYKFAEAALLVFSLNSLESFHCLPQHLLEILSMAENAKIFLGKIS